MLNNLQNDCDFSNYPKDHPLYSERNKLVPAKFKDELASKSIHEFVGLRSKLYSILTDEDKAGLIITHNHEFSWQ